MFVVSLQQQQLILNQLLTGHCGGTETLCGRSVARRAVCNKKKNNNSNNNNNKNKNKNKKKNNNNSNNSNLRGAAALSGVAEVGAFLRSFPTVSSNKISLFKVIVNNKNNSNTSSKQQKRKLIGEKTDWNQP
ncbi:unnamed protein product [Polarella glacialis]|uniref:Uncharacterized protein n=1 Tax=Polarella glacialis TaxID=89957 RepID=A0A813J9A0_POLGL|nr:unnamed protein product [Polarella glacialis]